MFFQPSLLSTRHWLTIGTLCAGLSQFSCSPKLLDATFSQDTIGQLPKKDIPGDPAGDVIEYVPQIEPRLRIVSYDPTSSNSQKALAISSKPVTGNISGHTTWLVFRGIQTGNFSKTINYLVLGTFNNFRDPILIDLSSGNGLVFARLEMSEDGTLYASENIANPLLRTAICRLLPDKHYIFSFQVNMKAAPKGTCRIGVIGSVLVNGQTQGNFSKTVPLLFNPLNNVQGPINPSIAFNWPDQKAAGQSQLLLTGVTIKLD